MHFAYDCISTLVCARAVVTALQACNHYVYDTDIKCNVGTILDDFLTNFYNSSVSVLMLESKTIVQYIILVIKE